MKKRILYLVMVLVLLCAIVPQMTLQASAEPATSGECGKDGNNLTWEFYYQNGMLIITGTGDMKNYHDNAPWKDLAGVITTVKIEPGPTNIGDWAFKDLYALEKAEIPDTVVSIGDRAFSGCYYLKKLIIGSGVTKISQDAFEGCDSMESLSLDMKNIETWFKGRQFKELILGDHVETVSSHAFNNCNMIETVSVGTGIKTIDSYAFEGCTMIQNVAIKDLAAWCAIEFTEATSNPLYYATNMYLNDRPITDLVIPSGVTKIGNYAFENFPSLKTLSVPASVTEIGISAFTDCINLEKVTLSSGLLKIDEGAFRGCSALTAVKVPDTVTSIGDSAFENCTKLTNVVLGTGLTEIGKAAFQNCTSILKVVIPDAVTTIGERAFQNCSDMRRVTMPTGLKVSGIDAFYGCTKLGFVSINDVAAWCGVDFQTTDEEKSSNLCPANPLFYARHLYFGDNLITILAIPSSVTKIADYAFINCTSLTEIDIHNGVLEIGKAAFSCSSPKKVTIPDSVTKIDDFAFMGCAWLEDLTLGANATDIGESAFMQSGIKKLSIPAGTEVIRKSAFAGCPNLDDVFLPNGLLHIEENAFNGCSNMYSISLPNTLETIKDSAFAGCKGIEHVCFGGQKSQWSLIKIYSGNSQLTNMSETNGNKFHWQVYTPLADHAKLEVHAAATCTKSGAERRSCSCGFVWTRNLNDEPALGHNWYEGKCTRCGAKDPNFTKINFKDVPVGSWYRNPVAWAVKKGITTGTDKTHFSPDRKCTRKEVVTFLWRAAGKPEPAKSKNPFTDINSKDYYYKAVLWAYYKDITSGRTETTFGPNYTCSRAQVVTFLWRLAGAPSVYTLNPFTDVAPTDYFYDAVLWAIQNKITNGISATTFAPTTVCTRAHVVTFLYRYFVTD